MSAQTVPVSGMPRSAYGDECALTSEVPARSEAPATRTSIVIFTSGGYPDFC